MSAEVGSVAHAHLPAGMLSLTPGHQEPDPMPTQKRETCQDHHHNRLLSSNSSDPKHWCQANVSLPAGPV